QGKGCRTQQKGSNAGRQGCNQEHCDCSEGSCQDCSQGPDQGRCEASTIESTCDKEIRSQTSKQASRSKDRIAQCLRRQPDDRCRCTGCNRYVRLCTAVRQGARPSRPQAEGIPAGER